MLCTLSSSTTHAICNFLIPYANGTSFATQTDRGTHRNTDRQTQRAMSVNGDKHDDYQFRQ